MEERIVALPQGQIRGTAEGGVARFLGVPYAAAPVGARRFKAPAPAEPWVGVRDCTRYGPNAPQISKPFPEIEIATLVGEGWRKGDDYLNLNVWAPDGPGGERPVMVFIHGGAFIGGANDAPVHDGGGFARSGVVCIAINYRLGIDGFLPIEGVPTNLGLRDQIAALQWVRDNAARFGGDPDNVTVFGESAGAMSVANLLASPLAEGLFRRAIVQSGHGEMVRTLPVARKVTRRLAKLLKIKPTLEGFRSVPFEAGLAALDKVSAPLPGIDLREPNGREPSYGLSRFLPVIGDDVLPEHPHAALAKGAGSKVEVLVGTNREEMNIYFVPTGVREKASGLLAWFFLAKSTPRARDLLKAYGLGRKGVRGGDALSEATHDVVFRLPARRFAQAHQGRTWFYEFDWRSPACGGELGACHALELPFVFDTLACATGPRGFVGENPPQGLADRAHGLWVTFASGRDLPWPAYAHGSRDVYSMAKGYASADADMPAARFWS
ncbi:carboxylesterase family protein [Caulobacter sp. 17J65-9]|uniref:carboxylesterase/lipase family protein n=1 Tax=Caulobacter sp. 17J65-9 TaxID=2709382 RepID=UPI0013CC522B|nr:carboxylesterase family protein [Caulobacter sp. 17J65-9]NEX93448.1 carboxylesterase/lipase family protein [Caulobacter sp. 17J65-9]